MPPRYDIGQKVRIKPVKKQPAPPKDSDIEPYAGQSGEVTDYYWIELNRGEVVYMYTVQIGTGNKEIVLHEDEIQSHIA